MYRNCIFCLVLSLMISGCTSVYQVRGISHQLTNPISLTDLGNCDNWARQLLDTRSIESFSLDVRDLETASKGNKIKTYNIGIVEFNDEGWGNPAQQAQVFKLIEDVIKTHKDSAGPLIVTFIHGWHHNPAVCDGNLACFRRVIKSLSIYESRKEPNKQKPVIGIFVGWRGDSSEDSLGKILSFYGRKTTAQHIGRTGGKDFLLELESRVKKLKEGWSDKQLTPTMITVGHSFGGALLFSAVEGKLIGNIDDKNYVRTSQENEAIGTKPLKTSFGDLVVLLNPAIEAFQYVPFDEEWKDPKQYRADQLPVLLTIASKADHAVGRLFPIGYAVKAIFEPWELDHPLLKSQGIGHYNPQITHFLGVDPENDVSPGPKNNDRCGCEYNFFDIEQRVKNKSLQTNFRTNSDSTLLKAGLTQANINSAFDFSKDEEHFPNSGTILESLTDNKDKNVPYLVISTDETIINGHNDIFNNLIVSFLIDFFNSFQNQKEYLIQMSQ